MVKESKVRPHSLFYYLFTVAYAPLCPALKMVSIIQYVFVTLCCPSLTRPLTVWALIWRNIQCRELKCQCGRIWVCVMARRTGRTSLWWWKSPARARLIIRWAVYDTRHKKITSVMVSRKFRSVLWSKILQTPNIINSLKSWWFIYVF